MDGSSRPTRRDYPEDLKLWARWSNAGPSTLSRVRLPGPFGPPHRTGHPSGKPELARCLSGRNLEQMLGVPVVVENDADCGALSEAVYGEAKESELLVYYGLGTGVGAGVVENGRIFHGGRDPESRPPDRRTVDRPLLHSGPSWLSRSIDFRKRDGTSIWLHCQCAGRTLDGYNSALSGQALANATLSRAGRDCSGRRSGGSPSRHRATGHP